jgi:tetratricopeptide (TPR) repeat protein
MRVGANVVRIADVGPITVVGGALQWHPLRKRLDVHAFGINAYTGAAVGDEVVESHDESELGHEEIYVVLTGRATFTVNGEERDVPAGSLVHLPDPTLRRHAVAAEPATTVLAIGGKPGVHEVSDWEYFFPALPHIAAGDYDTARAVLEDALEERDAPALHYHLARLEALAGDKERALAELQVAVDAADRFRAHAAKDDELASIRDDPRFPR